MYVCRLIVVVAQLFSLATGVLLLHISCMPDNLNVMEGSNQNTLYLFQVPTSCKPYYGMGEKWKYVPVWNEWLLISWEVNSKMKGMGGQL